MILLYQLSVSNCLIWHIQCYSRGVYVSNHSTGHGDIVFAGMYIFLEKEEFERMLGKYPNICWMEKEGSPISWIAPPYSPLYIALPSGSPKLSSNTMSCPSHISFTTTKWDHIVNCIHYSFIAVLKLILLEHTILLIIIPQQKWSLDDYIESLVNKFDQHDHPKDQSIL